MKYVEKDVKGRTVCQDCGCEYVTRKGPLEHRKNCSAFTQFKCFACNRGMNAMDGFHIHFSKFPACRAAPENAEIVAEIVARSQKPEFHVCYLCGAQYKAKESIEKHMLSHSETVEYFVCRQQNCGKKFVTQKNLDMHLKNHTMPKVYLSFYSYCQKYCHSLSGHLLNMWKASQAGVNASAHDPSHWQENRYVYEIQFFKRSHSCDYH